MVSRRKSFREATIHPRLGTNLNRAEVGYRISGKLVAGDRNSYTPRLPAIIITLPGK
jgi:hypothetical protein